MARYNEILVGRYNRRLQKLLGMKGEPPAPQLATEIQPSLMMFAGVEERYLEGWNLFSIGSTVTEVGGVTVTRMRLRNPAGSGVVGVLYFLVVSSSVANDQVFFSLGPQPGDLPVVLSGQRLDARCQVATGNLVPSTDTSGGASSPQIGRQVLSTLANAPFNIIQHEDHEIPILPGDSFGISPNAVAAGSVLSFWVMWRERPLEESERA